MTWRELSTGRGFAAWLHRETHARSGVYLIREKGFLGRVVYVGESHSDRLYQTISRHFQRWKGKTAGPTYPRSRVEIAIVRCPAEKAVQLQNDLIAEYRPRDNTDAKPGFWT